MAGTPAGEIVPLMLSSPTPTLMFFFPIETIYFATLTLNSGLRWH